MRGELYINGRDAWNIWGVNMGKGFLDAIDAPVPMKAYIENESRLKDGKEVLVIEPKKASREITLSFTIKGSSTSDFMSKRRSFEAELQLGKVSVFVPALGITYQLIYLGKSISYAMNRARDFCTFSSKFEEPDPTKRE